MNGLVDQDAAAFRIPFAFPVGSGIVSGGAVPGHKAPDAPQGSPGSFLQEAQAGRDMRVVTILEADANGNKLPGVPDLLPSGLVNGRGLFGENSDAAPGGLHGHYGMKIVRRAEMNGVRLYPVQHFQPVCISVGAVACGPFRKDIGTGYQFRILQFIQHLGVHSGNAAAPDQPNTKHLLPPRFSDLSAAWRPEGTAWLTKFRKSLHFCSEASFHPAFHCD